MGCYRPYPLPGLRLLALLTLLIGCSFKVAANMKIGAVWDVTPCSLIEFTDVLEECHLMCTKLDGVTSQKTVFFLVTSDLVTASGT